MRSAMLLAAATVMTGILASPAAWAQSSAPGLLVPQRDCQTIRTCRFDRAGSFRGCLSSYTCRVCRFVKARCEIGGRSQNCQEMRCTWGG
jgi:hypothetical protein